VSGKVQYDECHGNPAQARPGGREKERSDIAQCTQEGIMHVRHTGYASPLAVYRSEAAMP